MGIGIGLGLGLGLVLGIGRRLVEGHPAWRRLGGGARGFGGLERSEVGTTPVVVDHVGGELNSAQGRVVRGYPRCAQHAAHGVEM